MKILNRELRSLPAALLALFAGSAIAAGAAWAVAGPPESSPGASDPVCHGHGRMHGGGPGEPGRGFGPGHGHGGRFGPGWDGPGAPLAILDGMPGDLALTDAQWDQVMEIMGETRESLEPLREVQQVKHDALRELMHAPTLDEAAIRSGVMDLAGIRADMMITEARTRAKMIALLTPEQRDYLESEQARFEQRRERHREFRNQKRGARTGDDPGAI